MRLLAKISDAAVTELHDPERGVDFLYLDRKNPYFRFGYVDLKFPHATPITEVIQAGTEHYVLWEDNQGVLETFQTWQDAIDAYQTATFGYKKQRPVEVAEMNVERSPESDPELRTADLGF